MRSLGAIAWVPYARTRLAYARTRLAHARTRLAHARIRLAYARTRLAYARIRLSYARTRLPYARIRLRYARSRLQISAHDGTTRTSVSRGSRLTVAAHPLAILLRTFFSDASSDRGHGSIPSMALATITAGDPSHAR